MLRTPLRRFSTTRRIADTATCQLLGKFGTTPTKFTTASGHTAVRYVFAVNRGVGETQTTSWFNVVAFNEKQVERLTQEDLKGAKALVNGTLDVRTRKDEETGSYSDTINIKHVSMNLIERKKVEAT